MLEVRCSGTPYEIGRQHGTEAKAKVHGSIDFYSKYFGETAGFDWSRAQSTALQFKPTVSQEWPAYLSEMQGIADGASVPLASILAINIRTEIVYGMMREDTPTDGCTTLSWITNGGSWLAQNWDWNPRQKPNLVNITITQQGKPTIKMITEAGIIGKIGFNDEGVGCCLNAIRARGMDCTRMPVHLALRTVLESKSAKEAESRLREAGVASACSIGIADTKDGGFALECSYKGFGKVERDDRGRMFHSNHFLIEQKGVVDSRSPQDTLLRVGRIEELADQVKGEPSYEKLFEVFKDEKGYPASICRVAGGQSTSASLFNIIMELTSRRAWVHLGRAIEPEESFWLELTPNLAMVDLQ